MLLTDWPSLPGCLQLKRAFSPVVYPRRSSFKSEDISPIKYIMAFFLDRWSLRAIFAMPVGLVRCLQAVCNDCWPICNDCEP